MRVKNGETSKVGRAFGQKKFTQESDKSQLLIELNKLQKENQHLAKMLSGNMKGSPVPGQATPRGGGRTRETPRKKGVFESKRMTAPHAVATNISSNLGEYSLNNERKSP